VVRPPFRRRGLMHELPEGAVGHAHAMGATALERYPVDPGGERVDQTRGYVGTVGLFEAHGFRRVSQTTGRSGGKPRWLMRRELPRSCRPPAFPARPLRLCPAPGRREFRGPQLQDLAAATTVRSADAQEFAAAHYSVRSVARNTECRADVSTV
jgi:hypothetical protein